MARLRGLLVALVAVAALGACGTSARSVVVEQAGGNPTPIQTTPTSTRPTMPIRSTVAEQIATEIATLFGYGPSLDSKLAVVADGAILQSVVAQGMADPRAPKLTLRVTNVAVKSPVSAVATIDFLLSGEPAMSGATLLFTLIDGRWMAARSSYCALIATGGLRCPPPKGTGLESPDLVITVVPAAGPPSKPFRSR